MKDVFEEAKQIYGAVKIQRTLNQKGILCRRVQRHMAEQGLRCVFVKKYNLAYPLNRGIRIW